MRQCPGFHIWYDYTAHADSQSEILFSMVPYLYVFMPLYFELHKLFERYLCFVCVGVPEKFTLSSGMRHMLLPVIE